MKPRLFQLLALLVLILNTGFVPDIVIRHDRDDADYLTLGKSFAAVCRVGEKGGDGTLIGSRWILTAAHVADGMSKRMGDQLRIYFEQQKGYEVEAIFIHPDFTPMGEHDIALIKLKNPVKDIKPLTIYAETNEKGKEVTIVGHGDFKRGNEKQWINDGKRRAATNIIDETNAHHIIFRFDAPDSGAATHLEGTAGRGDSGGPALIKQNGLYKVTGVSSAGMPGENGPGTYGAQEYYTRVSTHAAWINDVMQSRVSMTKQPAIGDGEPAVLEGLGLILTQRGNKVAIEGKIDQQVPAEFRQVIFGNGSFIVSLNEKSYESLDAFHQDFQKIKKGIKYTIVFSVKGEIKRFTTTR